MKVFGKIFHYILNSLLRSRSIFLFPIIIGGIIRSILIVFATIFVLTVAIILIMSFRHQKCSIERTVITSPNNINEANLIEGVCESFGGAVPILPSVTVQKMGSGSGDAVEVYAGAGIDVPLWMDDHQLRITVIEPGRINKSLHRIGDITVVYQLADSLLEVNFLPSLSRYEDYWTNEINGEKGIREVDRVSELRDLQSRVHKTRENYREFMDKWANKNINYSNDQEGYKLK